MRRRVLPALPEGVGPLSTEARLAAFRDGDQESLPATLLVLDEALVRAVQDRLAHHGLLDPPADGFFGPVSQWALAEFCRARGLPSDGSLTRGAADALLAAEAALPLRPGGDMAGRVAAALLRRGDWLCRHPECLTVVYVEGMEPDGRPSAARPDAFDDTRLLLRVGPGGAPEIAGAWEATAAPGRPAVERPVEPAGAPRLARGQHKAWVMGRTGLGTGFEQEALVQVAPLSVTRDGDRDFRRAGDERQRGLFLMDQHGGLDAPRERVGGIGAGCLVGRTQEGHRTFMALLRGDARWRASHAYRFMASVLGVEEMEG
jgi:peptidoglycan hydrolase-like protein with peptidoglycan-binding domain